MDINKWTSKLLKSRDFIISLLSSIFFIFIIITFLGLWWVVIVDTHDFENNKFTEEGINYLFEKYANTIEVGTAFLAILAIYLTMRRMNQSQTQIVVMGANNQFNNFYKHRDEFVKHLIKDSFISNLVKYSSRSQDDIVLSYHGMYFGTNYESFNAKVKSDIMKGIQLEFKSVNQESVLSNNFNEFIDTGKTSLAFEGELNHSRETNKVIDQLHLTYREKFNNWEGDLDRLRILCNLYYDIRIKLLILTFSGERNKVLPPTEFIEKFEKYLNDSGLYVLII